MNCKKYKLSNNGNSPQFFSYQRCTDTVWKNNVKITPGQTRSISFVDGTLSHSEKISVQNLEETPNEDIQPTDENLGRLYSVDVRDLNFLIKDKIPLTAPPTTSRYWQDNIWSGNQGNTPSCVGFAWVHFLEDGPITHQGSHPIVNPLTVYKEAQKIDEWPGENYAGTSVRAGAKYLKNTGKISSYLWAFDLQTVVNTVLNVGPVVVGTNWYFNMFYPNRTTGVISAQGQLVGGHAYLLNGVDTKTKMFRLKNSWGSRWGVNGNAFISFKDMEKLIKENGEICLASEMKF